jgi:hypothetical protein
VKPKLGNLECLVIRFCFFPVAHPLGRPSFFKEIALNVRKFAADAAAAAAAAVLLLMFSSLQDT